MPPPPRGLRSGADSPHFGSAAGRTSAPAQTPSFGIAGVGMMPRGQPRRVGGAAPGGRVGGAAPGAHGPSPPACAHNSSSLSCAGTGSSRRGGAHHHPPAAPTALALETSGLSLAETTRESRLTETTRESTVSTTPAAGAASVACGRSASTGQTMLALLQAAPLVHDAKPVELLDLKTERDTVIGALQRSGRGLDVIVDFCTTRTMRDVLTSGCRLLHYSGHGTSLVEPGGARHECLAFENGEGGTHAVRVERLTALVGAGAEGGKTGRPPLDFAFVSACHSAGGGEAFVAAGVPHVVAVKRDAALQDRAACIFAEAFYHALAVGRTVRQESADYEYGQSAAWSRECYRALAPTLRRRSTSRSRRSPTSRTSGARPRSVTSSAYFPPTARTTCNSSAS